MARAEIVTTFGISLATLKRYLKQRRDTGTLRPKHRPGRPAAKGAALAAALTSQLHAYADATLEEHWQRWTAATGVQVSTATMSRAIRRLGWTREKRQWVPLNGTSTSAKPSVTN
jgi:transposase